MKKDKDFFLIKSELLKFAEVRGADKTYCPSEVARVLYENWRGQMDAVRKVADGLVQDQQLEVLQGGIVKNKPPTQLKGPIRLRKKDIK